MSGTLSALWNRVVAEHPRFSSALFPGPASRRILTSDLANPGLLVRAVAASDELFHIGAAKHQAQVWWYSLNNTLLGPALSAMVEFEEVPSLDLAEGELFLRDPDQDYWLCFHTDQRTPAAGEQGWKTAGQDYAHSLKPVVQALAGVAGASIRALWAISVDAVAGAAVSAGNNAFDPYCGVRVAEHFLSGMRQVVPELPQPKYRDFDDGIFSPTDVAAAMAGQERDVYTVPQRVSCCMIYRSPQAGLCLSCPKHHPQERDRLLCESIQAQI